MNTLKSLCLAAAASASLTACGGKFDQKFADAAPSYDTLSLDMTDADKTPDQQALGGDNLCHPHLFWRTRNVVRRLNHHTLKVLAKMDAVIDNHPKATTGTTHTWEKTFGDVMVRVTGTKVSDTEYSYVTEVKAKADPESAYVKVGNSDVTRAADAAAHTGKGSYHIDLTALKGVLKNDKAEGTLDVAFDVTATSKTIEVTLKDFTPDDSFSGPNGEEISPRDAHYVFTRSPGVGGSLKYKDQLILGCPANPDLKRADVLTVARWNTKDGKKVARADATATGGQLPSGDKVVAVTCADWSNASSDGAAEKYWMMKGESTDGSTIRAGETFRGADGPETCDAAFGPVPSATDNANDYDFTKINFDDSSIVPFN